MRGKVIAALLGLFLALAAGVEDLSLKDFDFAQVAGSGRLPLGTGPSRQAWETLQDLLPLEPPASSTACGALEFPRPLPCSVVGGMALDPGCGFPGAAPLQLSIPPVFRYLVRDCLGSNLEPQGSPRMKKMGAVMVQQEGPHLALTSVSDQ